MLSPSPPGFIAFDVGVGTEAPGLVTWPGEVELVPSDRPLGGGWMTGVVSRGLVVGLAVCITPVLPFVLVEVVGMALLELEDDCLPGAVRLACLELDCGQDIAGLVGAATPGRDMVP